MSKHTEGPWREDVIDEKIYGANDEVVVYEMNTNISDYRLIAAAPDLLEACKLLTDQNIPFGNAMSSVYAAIAKAEGRS